MEAKKRSMPTPDVRCVSGRQFMMIGRLHAAATHAVRTLVLGQWSSSNRIRTVVELKTFFVEWLSSAARTPRYHTERLVFRCRTTSANTAPCTSRRMWRPSPCASRHTRTQHP